jgi:hypothetical protein
MPLVTVFITVILFYVPRGDDPRPQKHLSQPAAIQAEQGIQTCIPDIQCRLFSYHQLIGMVMVNWVGNVSFALRARQASPLQSESALLIEQHFELDALPGAAAFL